MIFITFLLLLSAWGIQCNEFECMLRERDSCDPAGLLPKDFPDNAEELKTICRNLKTLGACMIELYQKCGYTEAHIEILLRGVRFINSVCEEDNLIYKVISSNIECISPIAREVEAECNQTAFTEDNADAIMSHEEQISDNYESMEILQCLTPLWDVSCRSVVVGFHCGSEVKAAVRELLIGMHDRYYKECTDEILQKLQPLTETYESIIEAEQMFKNEIKKRK